MCFACYVLCHSASQPQAQYGSARVTHKNRPQLQGGGGLGEGGLPALKATGLGSGGGDYTHHLTASVKSGCTGD